MELGQNSQAETQLSKIPGLLAPITGELPDGWRDTYRYRPIDGASFHGTVELQFFCPYCAHRWSGFADELNGVARRKNRSSPETILVTTNETILAGFGQWKLALLERRHHVHCIEYPLSEDEALSFILSQHQPWWGWNQFVRIRLALTLMPYFQRKALDNMRSGGKYKGSANLPKAEHIDVRQEIARIAGVGSRNVSNVKTILQKAHPKLVEGLQNGMLRINRAVRWCSLPRVQQMKQFINFSVKNETGKVIRQTIAKLATKKPKPDPIAILDALRQQETLEPGSVIVRPGRCKQTVVLVGQDQMRSMHLAD